MAPADPNDLLAALLAEDVWARRLAQALVGEQDGEQITQSVLANAVERPRSLQGSARAYWRRSLAYEAANLVRSRSRRRAREREAARPESSVPDPAEVAARVEQRRRLAEQLLELPEELRYALVLRYEEDLSASAIARRLGVPASTVRARLARGRELLAERLRQQDPDWRRALLQLAGAGQAAWITTVPATLGGALMNWKPLALGGALLALGAVAMNLVPARLAPGDGAGSDPLAVGLDLDGSAGASTQGGDAPAQRIERLASATSEAQPAGATANADEPPAAEPGRLLLRLVDTTGSPLPEAWIDLGQTGVRERPDAEGRIALSVPAALLADDSSIDLVAEDSEGRFAWTHPTLQPGETLQVGDLVLHSTARFEGRVVDAAGRAAAGVTVGRRMAVVEDPFEVETYWHAGSTDSAGEYTGLSRDEGLAHWRVGDAEWASEEATAKLRFGQTTRVPDIVLPPPPVGIVPTFVLRDDQDRRIAPRACWTRTLGSAQQLRIARRDGRGSMAPSSSPDAWIELIAIDERGAVAWAGMAQEAASELSLQLDPEQRLGLRLTGLQPGQSPPEVRASVRDVRWNKVLVRDWALQPDPDGKFTLGVPDRPLELELQLASYPDPAPLYLEHTGGGPIEIHLGEPYGELSGVVATEGRPVAGATVSIHESARPGRYFVINDVPADFNGDAAGEAMTDADGCFTLQAGVDGPAVLVARAEGSPDRIEEFSAGPPTEPVEIELLHAGRVAGRAAAEDGRDLAGTLLLLYRNVRDSRTVRIDEDGRFAFEDVAPGAWQLRPYRFTVDPDEMHAYAADEPLWGGPGLSTAWVDPLETAWVDLTLPAVRSVRLSGTLTIDGRPVSGWRVSAGVASGFDAAGGEPVETTTDATGRFELQANGSAEIECRALPPNGSVAITKTLRPEADRESLEWDLELASAKLDVRAGRLLSRVSYKVDLGEDCWAVGPARASEDDNARPTTVVAGRLRLMSSLHETQQHQLDAGPHDLAPGETLRIDLP